MSRFYFTFFTLFIYQLNGFCQINPKSNDFLYDDTPETKKIALQITQGLANDSLKVIAIYDWVVKNIDYDSLRAELLINQNIINSTPKIDYCSTTLSTRKAVCAGYSYLFSALCEHSGIKSFFIVGYAKLLNEVNEKVFHAWVVYKVNNKWYLGDPTWDSNFYKYKKTGEVDNEISYLFLMSDPFYFSKYHFPLDPIWQLIDNPIIFSHWKSKESQETDTKFDLSFNLKDSLNKFEMLNKHNQFLNSMDRIVKQGVHSIYGSIEIYRYHGKVFNENTKKYYDLKFKIIEIFNKRSRDDPKYISGFKKDLLPRLNAQENYLKYLKKCYEKIDEYQIQNSIFYYQTDDVKASFKKAEKEFIEERNFLNTAISRLESLTKK